MSSLCFGVACALALAMLIYTRFVSSFLTSGWTDGRVSVLAGLLGVTVLSMVAAFVFAAVGR